MAEPEPQTARLLRAPSADSAINVGTQPGSSNAKAFKVAGFTLLACLLLAGQAVTAYMVYSQRDQLSTLEKHTDRLRELSNRPAVARTPTKMYLPMNSMPLLTADIAEEKAPASTVAPKGGPSSPTKCQRESSGLTPVSLPDQRPQCDEQGNYQPEQCWHVAPSVMCWCVDESGVPLPGSLVNGRAQCGTTPANE